MCDYTVNLPIKRMDGNTLYATREDSNQQKPAIGECCGTLKYLGTDERLAFPGHSESQILWIRRTSFDEKYDEPAPGAWLKFTAHLPASAGIRARAA